MKLVLKNLFPSPLQRQDENKCRAAEKQTILLFSSLWDSRKRAAKKLTPHYLLGVLLPRCHLRCLTKINRKIRVNTRLQQRQQQVPELQSTTTELQECLKQEYYLLRQKYVTKWWASIPYSTKTTLTHKTGAIFVLQKDEAHAPPFWSRPSPPTKGKDKPRVQWRVTVGCVISACLPVWLVVLTTILKIQTR